MMKIVSWNTRGLSDFSKRAALKKFIINCNPDVVMIQESKKESLNSVFIKSLWSSKDIGWEFVASVKSSGGILTMWDCSKI